ncbi:E3 ubiquitin-protein ligase E3D-like [Dendronephthya gigantea]|uniref:E3 ubiquitin-protein ligase E3D-like n=1 Tax=Dendronephthya gigantea TaxID=151771 RepID=UPI0010698B4B|nr:E3 ubiquitin-protein ligase E3D-like [Dendronephthya gigantea]
MQEESCQILCKRCQAMLGRLNFSGDNPAKFLCKDVNNSSSVELNKHSITLYNGFSRNIFKNLGEETFLAANFISLTKTRMCHKFIVNKTSSEKNNLTVVLIWVLNTETKFISSLCQRESSEENIGFPSIFRAVKVLYKTHLEYDFKTIKDEWYCSSLTDIITFPEEICLKLLLCLTQNNKTQPPSLRTANSFNVSFLKLKQAQ